MYKLEYFGQISEDGLLKITNRKGLDEDLKKHAGDSVEITIDKSLHLQSTHQTR